MLSTLSTIGSAGEKRRRNNSNFNENLSETCAENDVLHGICALVKSPADGKETQRYSSSDSEGLQVHYNTDDDKEKEKKEDKLCVHNYEDIPKESTAGNTYVPNLCNQFEEMSKLSFQTQHNSSIHQHIGLTRESKNPSDLTFITSTDNLFDEQFDLEDFMFPPISGSVTPMQSAPESTFNASNESNEQKTENFTASQLVSVNTNVNEFCEANFNSQGNTTKHLTNDFQNIDNCSRHCNYNNICNDAFIESFDSSRRSSQFNCAVPEQNQTNSNFYVKRNRSDLPAAANPENNFPNLHSNPFPNSYAEPKYITGGNYLDPKSCLALGHWQENNGLQMYPILNGDAENEDMRRLSNISSDSRAESHDTDITDPLESRTKSMLHSCSKVGSTESKNSSSKKTAYNEKWGVKVFKAWCSDHGISDEFEKLTAEELNDLLIKFWQSIRKANGDYYGRNSLFNLRAMINKHLKGDPFSAPFDIVTDDRFRLSNECLDEQLKHLKGLGRTIAHKLPISPGDIRKLYESKVLSTSSSIALLRKVWFEITLHFCPKGGESQEKIKKTTFRVYRDECGRRYVARSVTKQREDGKTEARMYDTFGSLCPVKSFEFYLSKLHPMQPRLFQQPRKKTNPNSTTWYGKSPIGEKALQQMMAVISREAKLSKRYTNHCVRTTALQQFTELRKQYEELETPEPGTSMGPILENGLGDMGIRLVRPQEESILGQNNFREVRESMTSSEGLHLYNPTNGDVSSSHNCLVPYNHVTDTLQRRQCGSTPPMSNFIPLLENSDVSLTKRGYFSDVPLFPPPPYSEHNLQRLNSMPMKRAKTEEGYCQIRPQSAPVEPPGSMLHPSHHYEVGHSQHCASYGSHPLETDAVSSGKTFKELTLPSPIQVRSCHSKKRTRKFALKKTNKSSETIVSGFPFEFAEPNLDFEKSCFEPQGQS